MRFRRFLVASFVLLFAFPAHAWDLAVVSGFNYSHPSLNPDPPHNGTVSTRHAFDFGALLTVPLGGDYQLGTGLIRHARDTVLDDTIATTEERYSGWLIPMTFRFMRADFLGFGFGPYVAFLSPRTRTSTVYHSGSGSSTTNADDPNRKNYEIGLHVNLRLAFPVYHSAKVILDGSYLFGVTDLNKSPIEEDKTQELLVLVGLQIPLGGGASESKSADETHLAPADETPIAEPNPAPSPNPEPKKKKKVKSK